MGRKSWPAKVLAIGLALSVQLQPVAAGAPEPPACKGRDLLPEMIARDPAAQQRIETAAAATSHGQALLWRIARPGTAPSYLFGTVHLSDPRVATLPPAVNAALGQARRLVLEIADVSPKALGQAFARLTDQLLFRDGRSLQAVLSAEELQVAEATARTAGLPQQVFAMTRPWVITMLMAVADCERKRTGAGKLPLDLNLATMARQRGVPVVGLETIEQQLKAMAAVPEADQLAMLRASIKLVAQNDDMLETMVQRYLAREITKIWPFQAEVWRKAGFDPAAFDAFKRELVTVRNARMRDTALPLLAKGGTFIAVGALHLVGEDGLVALIRAAGYAVEPAE